MFAFDDSTSIVCAREIRGSCPSPTRCARAARAPRCRPSRAGPMKLTSVAPFARAGRVRHRRARRTLNTRSARPQRGALGDELGPGRAVGVVADLRASPAPGLDGDAEAVLDELLDHLGHGGHPLLARQTPRAAHRSAMTCAPSRCDAAIGAAPPPGSPCGGSVHIKSRPRSRGPTSAVVARAAEVGRARRATDRRARARWRRRRQFAASSVAEEVEHQRARPDLADRIGDALAGDVGRGAVHRLEQRRIRALGIEVGRRRDADRAAHGGPEVGQDVAEQVRADDDVEMLRAAARSAR